MKPRAAERKIFKLLWWGHQLLSGFLANDYLYRVSRQTRLSTSDKDDEIISVTVNRSPGIYLMAEENPGKPQGPFFPFNVSRITQHVREEEGKDWGGVFRVQFPTHP